MSSIHFVPDDFEGDIVWVILAGHPIPFGLDIVTVAHRNEEEYRDRAQGESQPGNEVSR